MKEGSQYAAASRVPLIKSPSLRVPKPVTLPPDIHPLPEDVNAYFVYPFTIEPHVLALEASRRSTLAAQNARLEACLHSRDDEKERRKRDALRRIAPGFEPQAAPLVPTRAVTSRFTEAPPEPATDHFPQRRSVMEEMVDQLAALDTAKASSSP